VFSLKNIEPEFTAIVEDELSRLGSLAEELVA
jgi:hypothetical protein